MTMLLSRLDGYKTYLGVIAACVYSGLIYLGYAESNDLIWTAIFGWTGVSLRLAMK